MKEPRNVSFCCRDRYKIMKLLNLIVCALGILVLLLAPDSLLAQRTGTLKVVKPETSSLSDTSLIDTLRIGYGDPEYFKLSKLKYRPKRGSKLIKMGSEYVFRKRIPSGYYLIHYAETGSLHSEGEIENNTRDGMWTFYPIEGYNPQFYRFDNGKVVPRFGAIY